MLGKVYIRINFWRDVLCQHKTLHSYNVLVFNIVTLSTMVVSSMTKEKWIPDSKDIKILDLPNNFVDP